MIAARDARAARGPVVVAAVLVASVLRTLAGGRAAAASAPAAVLFAAVLAAVAVAAGVRTGRVRPAAVAIGAAGGATLVAVSLIGLPAVRFGPRAGTEVLVWWVPLVTVVAATEEVVLRGVLHDALRPRGGTVIAIAAGAAIFALIHLPLYGMTALPVDACVGVFLGCLRVLGRGVTAPLVAHVVADVATGWIG